MLAVAAPPDVLGASVSSPGLVTTGAGVAALTGEDIRVEVQGRGRVFIGVARTADLAVWVGDATGVEVTGLLAADALRAQPLTGSAVVPDPTMSDIWLDSAAGEGSTALVLTRPDPEWSVAVVGPGDVDLEWTSGARHPAAWPTTVIGLLVAVAAVLALSRRNAIAARRRPRRRHRRPR